jgi:large subunit ribosomal protein L9
MANPIRVVLHDDVPHLGSSGDVVRVRPGYARNYLFPRGLAVPATSQNLSRVDDLKRHATQRAERELEEARRVARKLEATAVKLERAVGDENRMYGSVTSRDIEEAFAQAGVEVDRRKVDLPEPIKQLGLHEVPVRLHSDVTAQLRVEVVKKA